MNMTIFFASYGDMEGTKWANAQMLTDFDAAETKAGCQVGKISVTPDNNFDVPRRLKDELVRAKGPIEIVATVGGRSQGGKIVTVINDFKLSGTNQKVN
ncbi:hypothetical protein [Photobacterium sanguinicancri]|uniref:hypothetical protein n=1 Tax=Photobacterium sanguinicancri TaxID=875932 RepID=UPI0026E1F78F|nr:hypothetical protein [Photobacterium sanguinicancri]MDO6499248.1 hypothetical protein [Photobacterium sanguinicancri]MDO6499256.1 hypothetical protein [Photobacterium sanguinicancri]